MKSLLVELQNHAKDDCLLLRLLVYLSSEYDIDVILDYAPVHVVSIHISSIYQKYEKLSKEKVCILCNSKYDYHVQYTHIQHFAWATSKT